MTPEEAKALRPGDRVCFTSTPDHQGSVISNIGATVTIHWDGGTLVPYYNATIPHIQLAPKVASD